MANIPISLDTHRKSRHLVEVRDFDDQVNPGPTSPGSIVLTVTTDHANIATVELDADPRKFWIVGVGAGSTTVRVTYSGNAQPQAFDVNVIAAPNQGKVLYVSSEAPILK
mgnify:CR=1 FL=1